ncbi:LemA protein [Tamaricihabitans halophyticus]|uniref:LemA protein n=1 Tax=Tamaricihabitans halophyticus TaxID=1262583 RepID=A0A4R2RCS7_9PSEU|nr:LemA family protein [Tamaricihabitans halophyticus]TCP57225.1 LemA protein [Tamaricihabitans halophyticus]
MEAVLIALGVVVALIIVLVIAAISMKNKFATQHNTVQESWRQIDVELQRRHDLIGNLIEVVKASAQFEQNTLNQVVQARANAVARHGAGPLAQSQAEQNLNGALTNFMSVAESYPQLKANQDFRYLQEQMAETEDRIAAGRRFYNGNVKAFNTRFDTFPSSMFKGSYVKAEYYEVDDPRVRAAPTLKGAFDSLNNQQPQQFAQQPQQQFAQQPPQPQMPPAQPQQAPGQPMYGQQPAQPQQPMQQPQQPQQPMQQPQQPGYAPPPPQGQPPQGQPPQGQPPQGQPPQQPGQQFPPQG